MSNLPVPSMTDGTDVAKFGGGAANDFVAMTVADQLFGIPVLTVQDVLGPQRIKVNMNVVVDHKGELYALIVDNVGEVLSLQADAYERNPATLDPRWREVSGGIYRLKGKLLVVLEVARLLDFKPKRGAEAA